MFIRKNSFGLCVISQAGETKKILQPFARIRPVSDIEVQVEDITNTTQSFFIDDPITYQVQNGTTIETFSGTTEDLLILLATEFFNNQSSTGGGGSDTLYTADGTITDTLRTVSGEELLLDLSSYAQIQSTLGGTLLLADEVELTTTNSNIRINSGSNIDFKIAKGTPNEKSLQKIIVSESAPPAIYQNDEFLFYSVLEKLLYYWDSVSSKWLTIEQDSLKFADRGTTPNNAFLRFENISTSLTIGAPVGREIVIQELETTNNAQLSAETVNIFKSGSPVAAEVISSAKIERRSISPLTIEAGSFLSVSKSGGTNNNFIAILHFRRSFVQFTLLSVSIFEDPNNAGQFINEVVFTGADVAIMQSIEIVYNDPNPVDPVSDPLSLVEVSSGVWQAVNTYDSSPIGEVFDLTINFTKTGGSFTEDRTVTAQ